MSPNSSNNPDSGWVGGCVGGRSSLIIQAHSDSVTVSQSRVWQLREGHCCD